MNQIFVQSGSMYSFAHMFDMLIEVQKIWHLSRRSMLASKELCIASDAKSSYLDCA